MHKIDLYDTQGIMQKIRENNRWTWEEFSKKADINEFTMHSWSVARTAPTGKNLQKVLDRCGYKLMINGEEFRFELAGDWLQREARKRGMSNNKFQIEYGLSSSYIAGVRRTKTIRVFTLQYICNKLHYEVFLEVV